MTSSHQERIEGLQAQVVPVLPDDTMSHAARKAMLHDFIQILAQEEGARQGDDIEYVHQMRVATRRIRSIFSLLDIYFKSKDVKTQEERLRRVARALGDVRDLNVMIDNLKRFQETLGEADQAALQGTVDLLKNRQKSAHKHLVAVLDKRDYRSFVKSFGDFLTETEKAGTPNEPTPMQVRYLLPVIVYEHLADVRAYDSVIENAKDETLHLLRIEFKKLRYLLSIFEELLGKPGREFITELKTIQDHLGKLNDAVVAQDKMRELLTDLDEPQGAALQLYISTIATEAQYLTEGFPDVWRRFNTKGVQRQLATAIAGL